MAQSAVLCSWPWCPDSLHWLFCCSWPRCQDSAAVVAAVLSHVLTYFRDGWLSRLFMLLFQALLPGLSHFALGLAVKTLRWAWMQLNGLLFPRRSVAWAMGHVFALGLDAKTPHFCSWSCCQDSLWAWSSSFSMKWICSWL